MKKIDNSRRVNNKLISAIAILLIVFLCVGVVFAAVTYINAKGKIELISIELDAESEFSYTKKSTDLAFTFPGEQKEIQIKTTNKATPSVLRTSYSFALSGDSDSKLPQAVLVYFNGDYVGTLKELTDGGQKITGSYVGAGNGNTATDTFTLELHLGADGSVYDGKTLALTTSAYTETADYTDTLFVSTTAELNHAIDDINSGLFPDVKIVLLSDVAFGSNNTIEASCTIDLNGRTLSGEAVLDGEKACLNVIGKGGNTATYTLTQYDETAANALLLSAAQTALQEGVKGGAATDLFGHLKFYAPTVTVSGNATYTAADGVLTAASVTRSAVETLTIGTETVEFTILDTATALTADSLKNVPDGGSTIVTSDLYLPASIKSEGASIEWTSSDQSVMDASGRIIASHADKAPVTLYATINVNGTVTTKSFSFLVSAHTNEINFYKLVATVSPVILYEIGSVSEGTGLYQLPIVDNNSDYDYRKDYVTPEKTAQTGESPLKYEWTACPEIFLTDLSYSLLTKDDEEIYSYIGMEDSCVYLRQDTLNTYAEIAVSGTFETGETYESRVRIIIATGTDTEVLEEAFNYAQNSLQSIDILKNILATREESGMAAEKGDFTLPASYTAQNGNTYRIEYPSVSDVVKSIELSGGEYTVRIDPTKFADTETHAVITTKVTWGETSRSKSLYFVVPAAVHTADLGNATIFNTVKYQVFMQLPAAETSGNSGFSTVGATITNSNPDYILLRDILGDTTYKADGYYSLDGDYLYDGAETYDGCKELWLYTAANRADYTDTAARDLAALVNWATGRGTGEAQNAVTNKTALGTYGDTLSNGKEYLNDDEVTVIKTYYCSVTGKSEEDWNALWNRVAERAPGYIITNGAALDEVVKGYAPEILKYFQYNEVLQWATNQRDNDYEPTHKTGVDGITFAPGNFNKDLISTLDPNAPTTSITVNETRIGTIPSSNATSFTGDVTYTYFYTDANGRKWYYHAASSGGGGEKRLKYNLAKGNYKINSVTGGYALDDQGYASYLDDDTSYVTPAEAQVIIAYWVGVKGTGEAKKYIDALYANMVRPTYFTSEGVQILLSSLYSDANVTINGAFKTAAVAAQIDGELNTSGSKLQGKNVPAVVNLEDLSIGISYFSGLTSLYICGNEVLPAFLSEYGLNSALSRMVSSVKNVETLVMQHVADNYVPFVLTDIKKLSELRQIDVSDNHGVTNLSALVNTYSKNYTYVDFSHVNVSKEFQEYALTNLHCDVYYSETENETRRLYGGAKAANAALTYLDELEQIIAEKMFAATEVTDGTTASTVYWRIENGNKITAVSDGGIYPEIDSITAMNNYVSPYYYCETSFTYGGISFETGYLYRFYYDGENIAIEKTLAAVKTDDISQQVSQSHTDSVLETKITDSSKVTISSDESYTGDSSSSDTTFSVAGNNYTITFNCFTAYSNNRYLYDNNGTLAAQNNTTNDSSYMCLLTQSDYDLLKKYLAGEIHQIESIGATSITNEEYYIYFPSTNRYLQAATANRATYTLNETASSLFTFSGRNNSFTMKSGNYYIYRNNNTIQSRSSSTSFTFTSVSSVPDSCKRTVTAYYLALQTTGGTEYIYHTSAGAEFGYTVNTYTAPVKTTTLVERVAVAEFSEYYFSETYIYKADFLYYKIRTTTTTASYTGTASKVTEIWYTDKSGNRQTVALSDFVSLKDGNEQGFSTTDLPTNEENLKLNGNEQVSTNEKWERQSGTYTSYCSHVKTATADNFSAMTAIMQSVGDGKMYLYTGTSGSESVIRQGVSSTSNYTRNGGYYLVKSGDGITWERSGTGTYSQPTGDTMDSILKTANDHFSDSQYGMYYGMYYAYNGSTITTTIGNTYVQYGVYRLMPNAENTAFEFVSYSTFSYKTATTITQNILNNDWGDGTTNADHVGEIFCIPSSGGGTPDNYIKKGGFFILDYNADGGSYALKTMQDVDGIFTDDTLIKFVNMRSFAVLRKSYGYTVETHTGTGGTYAVTITAFVRIDGVEYVRRYSVDIVG